MGVEELYGYPTFDLAADWPRIVSEAQCPFLGRRCLKVRKSEPWKTIGSCSVSHMDDEPIIICPHRLLERQKIFFDAQHLLQAHEPGNELHVFKEFNVPGGSVDYVLASVKARRVVDFVGIELQTMDTTGTVWPSRQLFLDQMDALPSDEEVPDGAATRPKQYQINWKMTAKTILMQMHHKLGTFEHVNRRLVLVMQHGLLAYMMRNFNFGHLSNPASASDSLHFHAYSLLNDESEQWALQMTGRMSTDDEGMARALGLQADTNVELSEMLAALSERVSSDTMLSLATDIDASPVLEE